jgi:Tetratricopeptide repeat
VPSADAAVHTWTAWLGNSHPDTRAVMARLGVARRVLGDRHEALRLHQSNADAAIHLARSLRETGKVDEAVDLCRTVRDQAPGDLAITAELAASLRLAAVLRGTDVPDEAQSLQEKVASGLRERLGERHPGTLMAMTDVALTKCLRGGAGGAAVRDVESRLGVLVGLAHPFTLACGAVAASELYNAGEYAAALRKDRSLARKASDAWGADHPMTLALQLNVALDEHAVGQAGDADAVLATCARVLGVEHPLTRLASMKTRAWYDPDPPAWWRIGAARE